MFHVVDLNQWKQIVLRLQVLDLHSSRVFGIVGEIQGHSASEFLSLLGEKR